MVNPMISKMAKGAANSLLGINEKATIVIQDRRPPQAPKGTSILNQARALAGDVAKSAQGKMAGKLSALNGDKTFYAQFNPAQLAIYSHTEKVFRKSLQGFQELEMNQQESKATAGTTLSVRLLFDEVEVTDAFTFGLPTSPFDLAKGIATGASKFAQGKVITVRPQINAFMCATLDPFVKLITFNWAGIAFTGTLGEVQANYTMFSKSGEPIRGSIDLRIEQSLGEGDGEIIDQAFTAAFGQAGQANLVEGNALDKLGNLLAF